MKSRLTLLLLAAHAGTALAQYKCTASDGHVTFQQTPCFGAGAEEKLSVIPNGHPPAASGVKAARPASAPVPPPPPPRVESGADKRILARLEAMKQRDELEKSVASAQDEKARRPAERAEAIAIAKRVYGDDPANVQALRDALASIAGRYDAMAAADDARIKDAQFSLDAFDKAQAAAARNNNK